MPTSAAEPLLRDRRPVDRLRQDRRAARHRPHDRRGRGGGAARARTAPARPRCCAPFPACCRGRARCTSPAATWPAPVRARPRKAGLVHVDRRPSRVHAADACSTTCCSPAYDLPRGERAARVEEALGYLSGDRREAPRARGHAVGRPAADAGGGAGPGAPAAAPDAGRALRRPVAGAGRSRVRGGARGCARPAPRCCWSSS